MDDLVQWLRAQLDADEKVVRDGLCVNCENPTAPLVSPLGVTGYTHEGGWEGRRCPGRLVGAERVQNPDRARREIDAKRLVIAEYEQASRFATTTWGQSNADQSRARTLGKVVRLLALPYADKPGYREEWSP